MEELGKEFGKMLCSNCLKECSENNMECSHNVPIYLFEGLTYSERKTQADKMGRKNLCMECHDEYEAKILQLMCLNLLNKDIDLILNRMERIPLFFGIRGLNQETKEIGIKICLKLNEVGNDNSKDITK